MLLVSWVWRRLGGGFQWWILRRSHKTFLISVTGVLWSDDRVLVVRPTLFPKGSWALPGGYVNADETIGEALEREVQEELGLTGVRITGVALVRSGYRHRMELTLSGHVTATTFALSREILEAALVDPDDLPDGTLPSARQAIAVARTSAVARTVRRED